MEWVADCNGDTFPPLQAKRKYQHRKKEFIGWGSRELIGFLESIGKDTSHQISQDDAADIITEYINEHKLTDPDKKKRVNCDARLISLFGRKKLLRFSRIKIYNLLSAHYAKEEKAPDDDFLLTSGDEDMPTKRGRLNPGRKPLKNRVLKTSTSPFAAIVPDNLKLVYLKKSLVEDLLKDLDNFEQKVIGSFVRVKSDPNDYLQKNPYQLLQVTGIRKASKGANVSSEVLLRVPVRDIRISTLSEDSFTEEECEELCQKIKDGVYKKLTIVELEKKVQVLHEDITKHRIVREIALLQNLIERANEKGWRKESFTLAEYLERKQLLQTAAEQSRLLHEIPKVIPEQIKDDSAVEDFPEDDIDSLSSSEASLGDSPEIAKSNTVSDEAASARMMDFGGHGKQLLEKNQTNREGDVGMELNFAQDYEGTASRLQQASQMIDFRSSEPGKAGFSVASNGTSDLLARRAVSSAEYWSGALVQEPRTKNTIENIMNNRESPAIMDLNKVFDEAAVNTSQVIDFSSVMLETNRFSASSNGVNALTNISLGTNSIESMHGAQVQQNLQNRPVQKNSSNGQRPLAVDLNVGVSGTTEKKVEAVAQVIDLSSDDEDDTIKPPDPPHGSNVGPSSGLGSMVWYYRDPRGYQQGPFSLEMLKLWSDAHYFPPDFKVWMVGQNPSQASLLTGILRSAYHW